MLEGLKKILNTSSGYANFSRIIGAQKQRETFVNHYLINNPSNTPFKILDIGCGTGELIDLFPAGTEYIGIDPNSDYINFCINKYSSHKVKCQFHVSGVDTLDKLDIPQEWADIVVMSGVLHHLNDNQVRNAFKFSSKVLQKNGKFVSIDGLRKTNQNPFVKWVLDNDRGKYVRHEEEYTSLAKEFFPNVETFAWSGSLRIPSSHLIMTLKLNS